VCSSDLGLRWLYAKAKGEGATPDVLERIEARAKQFSADVESGGADGGVSTGATEGQQK
jgi:hypothetical protein